MNHVLKYIKYASAALLPALLLVFVLILSVPQEAEAAGRVIRVGYTDLGIVTQNEDGSYSGYTVDYLNEIAQYTGWKYEYIYGSWAECNEMLQNGELDLFGMVRYTPEREEYLLFSELSMAHDSTILCAREDSDFYYQDYEAIDGCTVGVVESSIYLEHLLSYTENLGINCQVKLFEKEEEAVAALQSGKIDLFATAGFFNTSNASGIKLIDRFELSPVYFVTGTDNQALMVQLDAAMQKIRVENYALETELTEKYSATNKYGLCLTREEQEYINSVGNIPVRMFGGRQPLAYASHGSISGMLPDYLDMLGEISGLTFTYIEAQNTSQEEVARLLAQDGSVFLSSSAALNGVGLYKSDSVFELGLGYVRRIDDTTSTRENSVFAVTSGMEFLSDLLTERGRAVRYYDTAEQCMEAVINGEADMTIQYEYVVSYLMQKPRYSANLAEGLGVEYIVDMSLYAPEEHALLVSILSKTVNALSEEQRIRVLTNSMMTHSYKMQFDDLLYEYGWWCALVLALIVILLLVWMLRARMNKGKQQALENQDLQQRLWLDEMTGVYNRAGFFANARDMISRLNGDVCIVRVNIYHFKVVNELYGLENGDLLLCELGSSLKELEKQSELVVGRFAADHFYLCVASGDMEKIGFARQISLPSLSMDISLTYGIYQAGGQMDVPLNIMCDRADMANTSARLSEEEYIRCYSDEERQRLLREQMIENEMERALEEEQFCIYIQPKYDIETEKIVGGEVLVRWDHPEKGLIPPNDFIGVFERNGFIRKLDHYVWEQCCRFMAQLRKAGLPSLPLSVNVSRMHFYGFESVMLLAELIERYELETKDLEIEITESFYSEDPDMIFDKCRQLREMGFRIAMDDFGSGYSSLNMLKEMPVDIIKMDLRFLSGDNEEDQADKGRNILRTLIELAHTLELQVVVEGLETKSQKEFIREIGTCAAQGYYFSPPIPSYEFAELLQMEEIDDSGLPAPPQRGNARRERLRREQREPLLEMIRASSNIFGYLIPEGCGILPAEMVWRYGFPQEIENMADRVVEQGGVSEASAPLWLELFAAADREEKSGSAIVELRNEHGNFEMHWLRFDTVMDQEGRPVMAVFTMNDFGNISARVQALVAAKQWANDEVREAENRRLKENEKLLRMIAQHSDRVVCHYDVKKQVARVWDKEICKRCRVPRLCETTVERMLESGEIMPESVEILRNMFLDIQNGKPHGDIKMRARSTGGKPRWFDVQYSTICDETGQPVSALISNKDITEQYEHEMAYLRQLQSITESEQSLGIMEVDLTSGIIELQDSQFAPLHSSAVGSTLVRFAEQMVPLKMQEKDWDEGLNFFSPEYMLQQYEGGARLLTRVWSMRFTSGKQGWVRFDVELIADPYTEHIRAFFRIWDVTSIKEKQLEVQRRSEQDGMTSLLNRTTAEACISAEIDQGENMGILVLLDLDQLKQINDCCGHTEGDKAITCVAETLKSHFRESDIIGRAGGDEFIVYMSGAAKNSNIMPTNMTALLRKLSGMAVGENGEWGLSCSIGYAVETEGATFDSLFKQADKALYHVKRSGRNNFAAYSPAMEEEGYILQADKLFSLERAKKSETDEVQQLISALTSFYQLVLSVNISANDYYLMEEINDGIFAKLPTFGVLDNFVKLTANRIHPDDVEKFMKCLSREALFDIQRRGGKSVHCSFRFLDQDDQYRLTEATAIFHTNDNGDLCDFTLVRWADDKAL